MPTKFLLSLVVVVVATMVSGCANQIAGMVAKEPQRALYDDVQIAKSGALALIVPGVDPTLLGAITRPIALNSQQSRWARYSPPISELFSTINLENSLKDELLKGSVRRFGNSPKVATPADDQGVKTPAILRLYARLNAPLSHGRLTLTYLFDHGTPNAVSGSVSVNFTHPSPAVPATMNCEQDGNCDETLEPAEKQNADAWVRNDGEALRSTLANAVTKVVRELDRRLAP